MKLLTSFLLVCLVTYIYCAGGSFSVDDYCKWQNRRSDLIKQLTPAGQATAVKILKDLQYISGAALQPVYDFVKKTNNQTVYQLMNSTDAENFKTLMNYFGYGNWTAGAGELRDECQDAKNIVEIVHRFSTANQELVVSLIESVDQAFTVVFPVVISINRLLDYKLYDQLKTENQTVLAALADLYLHQ